jgi:hypothetical protein
MDQACAISDGSADVDTPATSATLTATVTATSATVDSRRRTPTTVYLGTDAAIRVVVTPEKRKVGGSTPPLPIASEQPKDPERSSPRGLFDGNARTAEADGRGSHPPTK